MVKWLKSPPQTLPRICKLNCQSRAVSRAIKPLWEDGHTLVGELHSGGGGGGGGRVHFDNLAPP